MRAKTCPEDSDNPKDWPDRKKWRVTILNSLLMSVSPISSSMVAPAFPSIQRDLRIRTEFETQMVLSIFVLASAVGPLIISPLSELFGRRAVVHITCGLYLVFNLACAFSKNGGQLLAFRFLSGIGGSVPSIGGGILADCWHADERGRSLSFYYIFPLLGPAIGPILGAFLTEYVTWHWMFYVTSMLSFVIQAACFLALPETYGPTILHRRAAHLRSTTGNKEIHTEYEAREKSIGESLLHAIDRPCRLLITRPIVQLIALFIAYVYGLMYLALSTFQSVWVNEYNQRPDIASLNYISLALGFGLATQICAPINDRIYATLKNRNDGVGLPEFRVPLMVPGAILVPIGLFWYGWSVQAKTHWVVPNIGAILLGAGIIISMQCCTSYVIDLYTIHAASAVAATSVLRAIVAFGFPLFAPYVYKSLGYGWSNSVLALFAIIIGWPSPYIFWKYGKRLRANSSSSVRESAS
ncbi:Nn.00g096200.m01.CDS01 [Neocucurbitaria sp. VM-36]